MRLSVLYINVQHLLSCKMASDLMIQHNIESLAIEEVNFNRKMLQRVVRKQRYMYSFSAFSSSSVAWHLGNQPKTQTRWMKIKLEQMLTHSQINLSFCLMRQRHLPVKCLLILWLVFLQAQHPCWSYFAWTYQGQNLLFFFFLI